MLSSCALWALALAAAEPRPGEPVDLAEFGTPMADGGIGVEWTGPRDASSAVIAGIEDERALRLRIEWWGSVWPQNGAGGWMRLDDPWNGAWVRIATAPVKEGSAWRVAFPSLSKEEWEQAGDHRVTFRRTLKLRVVDSENAPLPRELRLHAFGKAVWAQDSFDIEHKLAADGGLAARIEVANGFVAAIESLPPPRGARVEGAAWSAHGIAGSSAGVRVRLLYADLDDRDSNDLTRATIRLGAAPGAAGFSFVPQDVRAEGALWVPDFGTLVALAERAMSWARNPAPTGTWPGRVRQRVTEHAEATRSGSAAACRASGSKTENACASPARRRSSAWPILRSSPNQARAASGRRSRRPRARRRARCACACATPRRSSPCACSSTMRRSTPRGSPARTSICARRMPRPRARSRSGRSTETQG